VKSTASSFLRSLKRMISKRPQSLRDKLRSSDHNLVLNIKQPSPQSFRVPQFKQLKHINKVLNQQERYVIKIVSSVLVISVCLLIGFNYTQNTTQIPTFGGQYNEALVGHPQFINPILSPSNHVDADLSELIYAGLLRYDENHQLIGDIASAYDISDDQKVFTFHLKNNVFWHDGVQVTADDVEFTIRAIQDPAYNSPLILNFDGVTLERVDDFTVKFTLNEPYAPFLENLTVGLLPAHIWSNISASYFSLAEYNIKPIGSGPYKFDELTKDKLGTIKSMDLVYNERYHNTQPFIESLTFKFYPDFLSASDALFNKNVQGISKLPRQDYEKAEQSDRLAVYNYELPQYTALFFNLSRSNVWKTQSMRQALHASFPKEQLIDEVLPHYGKVIQAPLLSVAAENTETSFKPDEAAALFDKNGWKLNEETGIRQKDGKDLTLVITTVDQFDHQDVARFAQQAWQAAGVQVELEVLPFSDIKEKIKQRTYDALLYGQLLGHDPDPYPFWHSTQRVYPGLNLSMFASKSADELIEKARTTMDQDKRTELYQEFNTLMLKELPALFLYQPIYNYAVDHEIHNVTGTQMVAPSDRFNTITQWYIKTKNSFFQK